MMLQRFWHAFDPLFPEQTIFARRLSPGVMTGLFIGLTAIFAVGGIFFPANGFIGFDWLNFYGIQRIPPYYPPWTIYVTRLLTWPILIGVTFAAFLLSVFRRAVHPVSAIAACLCLPLLWTVFLGQMEGVVLLGMLGLPWLLPLAMIKPQITFFGLGARREYILAFFAMLALSMLIWGNWPATMLAVDTFHAEGRYPQNIGLGWWGLPLFLATVWFSRGDMDMLMLSGVFVSPYLIGYSLLPLTPAVARLKPGAALVALVFSYLTLSSNWLGPVGWWLGWAFVLWVWLNLAVQRYPDALERVKAFMRWK